MSTKRQFQRRGKPARCCPYQELKIKIIASIKYCVCANCGQRHPIPKEKEE